MSATPEGDGAGHLQKTGLVAKILKIIIAVGTIPLVLAMVLAYLQGNESLRGVIGSSFKALAFSSATQVDRDLEETINRISQLSRHPTLNLAVRERNRYLKSTIISEDLEKKQSTEWNEGGPIQQEILNNAGSRVLKGFLKQKHPSSSTIKSVFITDLRGQLVASSNTYPQFSNQLRNSWITIVRENSSAIFFSDLERDPKLQLHTIEVALPLLDHSGNIQGAFHFVFDAKALFSPSIKDIRFGETGHVMLIDSEGVVMSCPILPTGHKLDSPALVEAVTGPAPAWVETEGNGHGSPELSIIGFSPLSKINERIKPLNGKRLYTFAWESSEELFAPTKTLFLWIASAGLFSIIMIGLLGTVAARRMVKPIQKLKHTAEAIGRGEKVEPLKIKTGDEIETLAEEINTMNGLLQKAFSGLEQQVEEKSREVDYLREYTDCILMSVPETIIIFDEELKIEYGNAAFEKLCGQTADKFHGQSLGNLPLEEPEKWEQVQKELVLFQEGGSREKTNSRTGAQHNYLAKDPLSPGNESVEDHPLNIEIGNKIFAYVFFDVAIEGHEGKRFGLIMKDITEEKKLLDQLTLADKLSGLGTLAAGIAHEMNNPLYTIMGYTEAIKDETDPANINKYANKVLTRSKQMASIILNLTGYSRSNGHDEPKPVDVNEQLKAATEMALLASYSSDIELEQTLGNLPLILAKPEEIQQVLHNIIRNSVQAMQGKGKIKMSSHFDGQRVVISIQDNGPGIPKEFAKKIFDPFFTTKAQGEGTGLGLNLVHRIVKKYGGNITVESDVGQGARFMIIFPCEQAVSLQEPESAT
ncbi:MAG: HAMP domain-containing protein [Candidatus Nitronauta litoralis]|uniref:histidine kinase n=1 Tax=Candidatus Nitronauta litoralis TaxID=2705533 RepID=A0A7T0BTJ2_9BACT|nr:MAG: HAMP domain-containing protein [Candidatus Nitronauta litoralis]